MKPLFISTWKHGLGADEKVCELQFSGRNSLDSVGERLFVTENDSEILSVGYGGLPGCGCFYIVRFTANGASPVNDCRLACENVCMLYLLYSKNRNHIRQVGFLTANIKGDFVAYSVRNGFEYVLMMNGENLLLKSKFLIEEKYIVEDLYYG